MNFIVKQIKWFLKKSPDSISNEKMKIRLKLKELKTQTTETQKQQDAIAVFGKIILM